MPEERGKQEGGGFWKGAFACSFLGLFFGIAGGLAGVSSLASSSGALGAPYLTGLAGAATSGLIGGLWISLG